MMTAYIIFVAILVGVDLAIVTVVILQHFDVIGPVPVP
jgi:hypothetical protein